MCHTLPDPGPTRLADPNRSPGRETVYTISIYYTVLGLSLTVLSQSCTCTCSIQTISEITKIIYIYQKNYHRSGVHHNLYTYTESHLLIHVQFLLKNFRDCGSSADEHLSLRWPALLMWDVLSSILVFCSCTYTD